MNAFNLYEAAFDSANDHAEPTTQYVVQYAEGAFDLFISQSVAQVILESYLNFTANGSGENDYFHMVEQPLSDIEL